MKKLYFVFNALAGKAQIKNHLLDIVNKFVEGGYEVTVRPTQAKLDAYESVKSHAADYDLIVCSGGDGTLN
ncbi:MAG: diacylglycerol kinase family protein, partial [Oscillospiraceae bacterium]